VMRNVFMGLASGDYIFTTEPPVVIEQAAERGLGRMLVIGIICGVGSVLLGAAIMVGIFVRRERLARERLEATTSGSWSMSSGLRRMPSDIIRHHSSRFSLWRSAHSGLDTDKTPTYKKKVYPAPVAPERPATMVKVRGVNVNNGAR